MTTIALVLLFISQVVGFYFLALLYMKVTRFNDLEKKQRQLMTEMDDSIAAYLSELKDENARLIAQLDSREKNFNSGQPVTEEPIHKDPVDREQKRRPIDIVSPAVPLNLALKSYKVSHKPVSPEKTPEIVAAPAHKDARTLALELHDAGRSNEEIAKILGKGRTEVELILKFR